MFGKTPIIQLSHNIRILPLEIPLLKYQKVELSLEILSLSALVARIELEEEKVVHSGELQIFQEELTGLDK